MTETKSKKSPLVTGACLAGWHEGTKPRTRDGKPIQVCLLFDQCPCECHETIDELYELGGMIREPRGNPDYIPVITHVMPETIEQPLFGSSTPKDVPVSPAPGVVPGMIVRDFGITPSGRFARGQLETLVKKVIDIWVIESMHGERMPPCTPVYISEQIAITEGIAEPQLGGINGILDRWRDSGIAIIEKKPTRFTAYTPEAIEKGIDWMRDKFDRRKKGGLAF